MALPLGECTVQIKMPEFSVVVTCNVIVDDTKEDLLLDATMTHYPGIQLKYVTEELICKDKIGKG